MKALMKWLFQRHPLGIDQATAGLARCEASVQGGGNTAALVLRGYRVDDLREARHDVPQQFDPTLIEVVDLVSSRLAYFLLLGGCHRDI